MLHWPRRSRKAKPIKHDVSALGGLSEELAEAAQVADLQILHNRLSAISGDGSAFASSRKATRRTPLGVMMGCVLKLRLIGQSQRPRTDAADLPSSDQMDLAIGLPGRIVLSG
jgi:hypothetical protein